MTAVLARLSHQGRLAIARGDWSVVEHVAQQILSFVPEHPEGLYFHALVEKARGRSQQAAAAFRKVIDRDAARYDAIVELAYQLARGRRHGEADTLIRQCRHKLSNSPVYLALAGTISTMLGQHQQAYELHAEAVFLQPSVDSFQASLAASEVTTGRLHEAAERCGALIMRNPQHQRNHYEFSQLVRAKDRRHIEQMTALIARAEDRPDRSIWLRYAIAKELEDLGCWDEAFYGYEQAGKIAVSLGRYNVADDVDIIRALRRMPAKVSDAASTPTDGLRPIFVVGLPRTGSTIVERILASHSKVNSLGETRYLEWALARAAGQPLASPNVDILERAASADPVKIRRSYLDAVAFRLDSRPVILDKLPENFLYLKFVAEAFPDAIIIHVRRHAMDNCFALFKQSFFRFAYTLDDLARYYIAHRDLQEHWRSTLGPRLVETSYEDLVAHQEDETRRLLAASGLDFEPACLAFERNTSPVATASSAQVREKIHQRSVGHWRHFEAHLSVLRTRLQAAGIATE